MPNYFPQSGTDPPTMATDQDDPAFVRELLESVVEMSPDLIYFKNADHELVYVGQTYADIFDAEPAELHGLTARDLWPGEEATTVIEDEKRVLSGEPVVGREREVTHPDGTTHWYSIHKLPRYDETGSVQGFFAIDREITARKERERRLERYRSFVEHVTDVIVLISAEAEIEYVSPAVESVTGYSQSTLRGSNPLSFIHPEDRTEVEAAFGQLAAEAFDVGTIEFRLQRPEGEWIWMEASGTHRPEVDDLGGALLVAREITDRKRREREWRRMKRAVDASGHAIYITDTEGVIEYANPAFEAVTGYAPAEAVGQTPKIMQSGEMDEAYYENLWATIRDGRTWEERIINQRKSGEQYHARQTIAPIRDETGTPTAFVAIQTEVTDRVKLEERLSVVNRILRHDIRSAVSVIRGNANLAMSSTRSRETALETIQSEAKRLHRLGENARFIERALADETVSREPVELAEVVPAQAMHCRNEFPEAVVSFEVPETARVVASSQFGEALSELCTNAIIHNEAEHPTVELRVEMNEGWATIEVEDDGPGIPADEIDPIEQGGESALEHSSGLGLWVVAWIVEESGGELDFKRTESGSVVSIRLPTAD